MCKYTLDPRCIIITCNVIVGRGGVDEVFLEALNTAAAVSARIVRLQNSHIIVREIRSRSQTVSSYFQHAHFIPQVGVGKRGAY